MSINKPKNQKITFTYKHRPLVVTSGTNILNSSKIGGEGGDDKLKSQRFMTGNLNLNLKVTLKKRIWPLMATSGTKTLNLSKTGGGGGDDMVQSRRFMTENADYAILLLKKSTVCHESSSKHSKKGMNWFGIHLLSHIYTWRYVSTVTPINQQNCIVFVPFWITIRIV